MNRSCERPQEKRTTAYVFVNDNSHLICDTDHDIRAVSPSFTMAYNIEHRLSQYITHFFSTFLRLNDFTGNNSINFSELSRSLQQSPSLQQALVAIAALNLRGQSLSSRERSSFGCDALESYRESVKTLKIDISKVDCAQSQTTLWCTFFLGLFEVVYSSFLCTYIPFEDLPP